MINTIKDIIINSSNTEIADHIINTYIEIEREYIKRKWKISELESGHFVESVRRYVELKLFGNYKSFSDSIGPFNNTVLNSYEQSSGINEYRIIIPRLLFSIYCIRNKRGVGHIANISPNHQDAVYVLSTCKWILAEIIRLESSIEPDETMSIIDKLTNRQFGLIWDTGERKRILIESLKLQEKILIHLFDQSPLDQEELILNIESTDRSYFKKILIKLHKSRFIEYREKENICSISPKGEVAAEKIITKLQNEKSL
ncbi:hypothetical protein [Marispirochaeta aestuarii]|uniref:hypothetical protein n=1 Tax=Marispirochaeta aestuarii TaxID=1963862 RepID=UPI0029C88B1B|nr:hypothetical protein [Marispirochaeta aestuarii]